MLLALAGCRGAGSTLDLAAPIIDGGSDGPAYVPCTTFCLRPGDCAFSYNADGVCPFGFLCALTFQCVADGGAD
jgi:hypothetical protein